MNPAHVTGAIAAVDKHKVSGIVGMVLGALALGLGVLRVVRRTAGAMFMAFIGIVVVVLGILLYLRKI